MINNLPLWAEMVSAPSQKVSLMSEWETKMKAIVNETIKEDIRSMAGVPSWMLVLLQKVLAETGRESIFGRMAQYGSLFPRWGKLYALQGAIQSPYAK